MASTRSSARRRELPSGYTSIRDILSQSVSVGRTVSVIGLLKDHRLPIPTNGSGETILLIGVPVIALSLIRFADWKCVLRLYDKSTEDDDAGIDINIFRPQKEMPNPSAGDVVVLGPAKVQIRFGEVSLLSNKQTVIHVYSSNKIPKPPNSAKVALHPPLRATNRPPTDKEHEYVSWLYNSIDKEVIPDRAVFQEQAEASRHVRDKFSKLQDVREGKFCDIIVHVVREPFDQGDITTLWVSDFTENEYFYKFTWDGTSTSDGREGDPYGYVTTTIGAAKGWSGPYGKRSMQITCYEPHSSVINTVVTAGKWVRLRNLQVKYGRNGSNLEGFLREDRAHPERIQVEVLETDDRESIDPRHKEAIKRKYDYEKQFNKQKKNFAANGGANKRKADDANEPKSNSKARRQAKREAARKKAEEQERRAEERLGLNELIKCESQDIPVTPVSAITEAIPWTTTVDGREATLTLPFACAKYRANVRVVDFRPRRLVDFAVWRKNTEYDVLSDCSSDSGSSSDDDDGDGTLDRYAGPRTWEWRFALQLEDADPKLARNGGATTPPRFWVLVDNTEGQQLTGLDAGDLRADPSTLSALREVLFRLWGNLEELQTQEQARQRAAQRGLQPPASSPPPPPTGGGSAPAPAPTANLVSNKPFACCVRQYGVRVRERDPDRADAGAAGEGRGWRWQRVFGIFGTKISE
ncbi:hypothetical protein F4780DRAFT_786292 [Xylariomycetidae sp. FL0641]|nr:hypothetical protein F4780DRAFT_786292 [Xylariomycetidae sp. FL0641]